MPKGRTYSWPSTMSPIETPGTCRRSMASSTKVRSSVREAPTSTGAVSVVMLFLRVNEEVAEGWLPHRVKHASPVPAAMFACDGTVAGPRLTAVEARVQRFAKSIAHQIDAKDSDDDDDRGEHHLTH